MPDNTVVDMPARSGAEAINQAINNTEPSTDDDTRGWTTEDVIKYLNYRHAVINYGNRVLIMTETFDPMMQRVQLAFLSQSDFSLMYANKLISTSTDKAKPSYKSWAKLWLADSQRRQYKGIVFMPEGRSDGYYNLWQGFDVDAKEGDCGKLKEHVLHVLCKGDQEKYDYLWKWCAHLIQKPAELPETAIVFRGKQGTGKNTFVDALGKIYGRHYIPLTHTGQVCGRFNAHLMDAVLVFANEAVWGGDKQGEGSLKAMITDGITTIEGKHKDVVQFPNYKRIIAASNESWAVPRGIDDRRFFCLDVSSHRKGDAEYFKAIYAELEAGGIEALLHELLHTDLTDWHPRNSMPEGNSDGEDMKLESMSSVLKFWLHCLVSENNHPPHGGEKNYLPGWVNDVIKNDLYDHYLEWCNKNKINHPLNDIQFTKELKEAVQLRTTRPRAKGDLSNVHRPRYYIFPELNEARAQFQVRIANIDFDDDEAEE